MKNILSNTSYIFKIIIVYIGLITFYVYAFLWLIVRAPRNISSMSNLLQVFYYDFLRLKPEDIEIIKLAEHELITISRNSCPILKLSLRFGLDTRYTCKIISESVCKYVLRKLNPNIIFKRDYNYIRPYKSGCLEILRRKEN